MTGFAAVLAAQAAFVGQLGNIDGPVAGRPYEVVPVRDETGLPDPPATRFTRLQFLTVEHPAVDVPPDPPAVRS